MRVEHRVVECKDPRPGPRSGHQAVAAAARGGEALVLGGCDTPGDVLAEVWALDGRTNVWRQVETEGCPKLWGHAACVVSGLAEGPLFLCFGGATGSGEPPAGTAAWALDPAARRWSAPPLAAGSGRPPWRCWSALAPHAPRAGALPETPQAKAVLLGGRDLHTHTCLADAWVLDLQDPGAARWERLPDTEGFQGRYGHSATAIRGGASTCVFGGHDGSAPLGDLRLIDWSAGPAALHLAEAAGQPPKPRSDHAACCLRRALVAVVGGLGAGGEQFNDVHLLDAERMAWVAVDLGRCFSWPPRMVFTAWSPAAADEVLLFGGSDGLRDFDDLTSLKFPPEVLTFASSNFMRKYDRTNVVEWQHELLNELLRFLVEYARDHGEDKQKAEQLFRDLEAEGMPNSSANVEKVAVRLWTSTSTHGLGREFSSLLNESIRSDRDGAQLEKAVVFCRAMNRLVVSRDLNRGARTTWPTLTYRGTGMPEDKIDFFVAGLQYRVPMLLATSCQEEIARIFLSKIQKGLTPVMFLLHIHPVRKCLHALLIDEALHVNPHEKEVLFAAYSAFTVRCIQSRPVRPTETNPVVIELDVATDNKEVSEYLTLAEWH